MVVVVDVVTVVVIVVAVTVVAGRYASLDGCTREGIGLALAAAVKGYRGGLSRNQGVLVP